MEAILLNIAINGGPSAVVVITGHVMLNWKISDLKRTAGENREAILELREDKRWKETCEITHTEVDRRLDRLEAVSNGRVRA